MGKTLIDKVKSLFKTSKIKSTYSIKYNVDYSITKFQFNKNEEDIRYLITLKSNVNKLSYSNKQPIKISCSKFFNLGSYLSRCSAGNSLSSFDFTNKCLDAKVHMFCDVDFTELHNEIEEHMLKNTRIENALIEIKFNGKIFVLFVKIK